MKTRKKRRPLIKAGMIPAATVTTALVSPATLGAPGDLDPSFGDLGRLGPILSGPVWSMEPQSDGTILLGGGSPGYFYWGWYGMSGFVSLVSDSSAADPVLAAVDLEDIQVVSAIRQPDDYIIVAGRHMVYSDIDTRLVVIRLKQDGTRDAAFGTSGEFRLSSEEYGTRHGATSLVLEPDGRIVVAGSRDEMLIVLRLLPDGSLDNSFAVEGVFEGPANIDFPGGQSGARTGLLRTASGGYRVMSSAPEGCQVVALSADGHADQSFGNAGIATVATDTGPTTYCNSMDIQPNGRLLVAGHGDGRGFAARLLADGQRDSTFIGTAISAATIQATAVAADGDAAVVVAGTTDDGVSVFRLGAGGDLDTTFGDAGIAIFDLKSEAPTAPVVNDLFVGADRKIIGAGGVCPPDTCWWSDQAFVVRLLGDAGHSPGVIGFKEQSSIPASEDDGEVVVNVRRTGGRSGSVGVTWRTVAVAGEAMPGEDYATASGNLTWADGDTSIQQIRVPILADNIVEENELFHIELGSQGDGAGLGKHRALIFIQPDGAPHGQFGIASDVETTESQPARVSVFRNFYSSGMVTVTVTPVSGTAREGADFVADPVVLTWEDGESGWKDAVIPIVADSQPENTETFSVVLSNPTGGALIGPSSTATVRILARGLESVSNSSGGGAFGWVSLVLLGLLRRLRRPICELSDE